MSVVGPSRGVGSTRARGSGRFPLLGLEDQRLDGPAEGGAAEVVVADDALGVDEVDRRPFGDAPLEGCPFPAAAVPERTPVDPFLLRDHLRRGAVVVAV